MATIVFGGGHELKVREDASTVIQHASAAAERTENLGLGFTDGTTLNVAGWFSATAESGAMIPVRPDTIAYILP
jgi:hypothetical protein